MPCSLKDCNKLKATAETKRQQQQKQPQSQKTKKPKGNDCLGDGCLGGLRNYLDVCDTSF
ncbi:MAG: hypothetical protein ACI94Y_001044 [Maribacter sp.]